MAEGTRVVHDRRNMVTRATLTLLTIALLCGPVEARSQEADVRASVEETLKAWSGGDLESFADFYHSDTRGFFMDGGVLVVGFDGNALRAGFESGFRAELTLRDLDVKVYESTAVSVAYLDGSITLPNGTSIPGTWRYSEARVWDGSDWKIVQYHFSRLTVQPVR
jgi:hypothetical protein